MLDLRSLDGQLGGEGGWRIYDEKTQDGFKNFLFLKEFLNIENYLGFTAGHPGGQNF